jgi:hypothetical protein
MLDSSDHPNRIVRSQLMSSLATYSEALYYHPYFPSPIPLIGHETLQKWNSINITNRIIILILCLVMLCAQVTPSDFVLCCKKVSANRSTAPVRVELLSDTLLFQLLQKGCEERPCSIQLIRPDEKPSLAFYCIKQESLISIWYLLGVPNSSNRKKHR